MSGCYPGCFYYSDSCFRKDCKMSYDGNEGGPLPEQPHERRGYEGHHPVHQGLQRHSVSEVYPLALVGYGDGDAVRYRVENLMTGQALHVGGHCFKVYETTDANHASKVLDSVHRSGVRTGTIDYALYWAFASRDPVPLQHSVVDRPASVPAATAAEYRPTHGGYPTPPAAFNRPGQGPQETR